MTKENQMDDLMQRKHSLVDEALAKIMHVGTVEAMKWAVEAAKAEERVNIINLMMIQHEAAAGRHNYWHVAANLIEAESR